MTEKEENILYELCDMLDNNVITVKEFMHKAIIENKIDFYDVEDFINDIEIGEDCG